MRAERRVSPSRPTWLLTALLVVAVAAVTASSSILPNTSDSLKFAVIGDNGTGDQPQFDVAGQMIAFRREFPFDLVLMAGDNFYGSQRPSDLEHKFSRPYKPLLDAGVVFRAALGNHDDVLTINFPPINMGGERYYTYTRPGVRFVVLDTNVLDDPQLSWAEDVLRQATEPWKIVYFHHPLYGNAGRHGANVDLRIRLEPLLRRFGVQVVFSGHDHVYERLTPQNGIQYFVVGSSGKLRRGDLRRSASTAAGFDQDNVFMAAEIVGDRMHFQVISRTGQTVDSGQISRSGRQGS